MRMKKKHNEKRPRNLSAGVLVTALLLTAGCGTVLANQTETALEEPVDEIKDQEPLASKEDIERDLYDMLEKRARGSGVFFAPEQAAAEEKFFAGTEFTIYEGNWEQYYAARIEAWFKPDSGGPERKLTERIFKIEGWMR